MENDVNESICVNRITQTVIYNVVQNLNSGKAADEFGWKTEHFKNVPAIVFNVLSNIFGRILENKNIPDIFKSGILTPVLKKCKNVVNIDNYRGTPFVSYFFESTI